MAIGVTLLAGVTEVFMGARQTDRMLEAISRMQESGRFAVNFLSQDIRMAGYLGCLSSLDESTINNTLDGPPPSFQPAVGIQGWEATNTTPGTISNSVVNAAIVDTDDGGWTSTAGNVLDSTDAVPAMDIVRIWSTEGSTGSIIDIPGGGADTTVDTDMINIADGDILLLSDCDNADWVQACNVQEVGNPATLHLTLSAGGGGGGCTPGNVPQSPLNTTTKGEVVKLSGTQFYIGKRGNSATNLPALFRRQLGNDATLAVAEELVEGIENMQLLYGENIDGDNRNTADTYVSANLVSNWANVVSVRITLLVQSVEDNLLPAAQAYTFNGVIYDGAAGNGNLPNDNRLRRVFTSTISLRNRTLGS